VMGEISELGRGRALRHFFASVGQIRGQTLP